MLDFLAVLNYNIIVGRQGGEYAAKTPRASCF